MARVTGNVVRQAQAVFLTAFRADGGPLPADLSMFFPKQPVPGTTPIAILQTVPGGFVSATQAIRELIDHARTRLDIMNPYFTDADIVQRVVAAAKRGVKVRIVVSGTSNNPQATAAFKHHYDALIDAGAQIWEYPGAVVHAKLIVADNTAVFGTVNLDAWALYRNFEIRDDGAQPRRRDRCSSSGSSTPTSRSRRPARRPEASRPSSRTGCGTGWRTFCRRPGRIAPQPPDTHEHGRAGKDDRGGERQPDAPAGAPAEDVVVVPDVLEVSFRPSRARRRAR